MQTGIVENKGEALTSMYDGQTYEWEPRQQREFPIAVANWFVQKHKQLSIVGRYGGSGGVEIVRPKGFTMGVQAGDNTPAGAQKPKS